MGWLSVSLQKYLAPSDVNYYQSAELEQDRISLWSSWFYFPEYKKLEKNQKD